MNKKLVSTFIALTILTSMAATGCSNKNNQKETTQSTTPIEYNEPGTFPIVKEKQEISIVAPDTAYILDLNTNDFTKWFEEKTNIKFQKNLLKKRKILCLQQAIFQMPL